MPAPMAPAWAGVLANEMMRRARPPATPAATSVSSTTESSGPHWMPKIRRPAMSSTTACASTVRNTETNLPPMIVPCRVGVVNRRGMVPSRSSVRIVRAALPAPKNMKKIIMPERMDPVTLTSVSVAPAFGERWLISRPAETPPA